MNIHLRTVLACTLVLGAPQAVTGAASAAEPPATYGEAMGWYERAARAGDPQAQFLFAYRLHHGLEGAPDVVRAAQWYRAAAEQGHPAAAHALGVLYQSGGGGLIPDPVEAVRWYQVAAVRGVPEAQFNLALLYRSGPREVRNPASALEWLRAAAAAGLGAAMHELAMMHLTGAAGLERDPVRAALWLERAVAAGHEAAMEVRVRVLNGLDDEERARLQAALEELGTVSPPAPGSEGP